MRVGVSSASPNHDCVAKWNDAIPASVFGGVFVLDIVNLGFQRQVTGRFYATAVQRVRASVAATTTLLQSTADFPERGGGSNAKDTCVPIDSLLQLAVAPDIPQPLVRDSGALVALVLFCTIALGVPLLGNMLMVSDIRRYLRSLRRTLVAVSHAVTPGIPYWARRQRPPCLETLGLQFPCTEEQVLAAYRQKVKELHPDKGGSLHKFLQLQKHYEQAMYLVRTKSNASSASVK